MTTRPIELARDADLRLSQTAMRRAALRAREIAQKTGTAVVVCRNGIVEHIQPRPTDTVATMQEPAAPYRDQP